MAGEGYGTTSINTGSAQVVGSPSFNIEKYAQPLIAKRKEDAVKAAAKAKSQERILGDIGKIKTIASPRYQPFIEQGKKDVLEKAKKAILTDDIYDKMALTDAQQKLNTMIDGAKKTDALYGNIGQQMLGGGNYWNKEHFDDYHKPLQTDDLSFDGFLKTATEDANKATQIRKDTYNPIKFNDDMNATARTFYGTQGNFTEQDLRDTLETMFSKDLGTDDPYHFDTYQHYVMDAKRLPDLQTKYKGDIPKAAIDLAVNDFIQLTGIKPKGKGLTINNYQGNGDQETSFDQYKVTQQSFKEGFGVGGEKRDVVQNVAMYAKPVEHGTFKVPVGGTVNGVPSDGTIVVKDVKFNLTKQKAVMDEDITYNKNGVKVTVRKGDVINIDDIPSATRVLGRQPKYVYKYISEGYTPTGQIVNVDADFIAPASVAALKGSTGKGALGVYQEQSNKELQVKGAKVTGGDNRTNAKLYSYNGVDYSYDELVKENGKSAIDNAIKSGYIKKKK